MSEKYLDQEFILRSDGKFYKRTTVISPVQNADQMLSAVKDDGIPVVYPFNQLLNLPAIGKSFNVQSMLYSNQTNHVYTITELNEFPFPESWLAKPDDGDHYNLGVNNTDRDYTGPRSLIWNPTVDNLKLYLLVSINFKEYSICNPILFVVDQTKTPYVPNIPNVYDDGRICTGDDYKKEFRNKDEAMLIHAENMYNMYRTPCNNDLRNHAVEKQYIKFTGDGSTIPTLETPGIISDNDFRFYIKCTNSKVIDFLKNV